MPDCVCGHPEFVHDETGCAAEGCDCPKYVAEEGEDEEIEELNFDTEDGD